MRRRSCLKTHPVRDDTTAATIYTLSGRLIGRAECFEFLEDVRDDINDGYVNVILDIRNIEWINSTGVGILAAIYTAAHDQGGQLMLANVPAAVRRFLDISKLWGFMTACDSVADALSLMATVAADTATD
jgi:anti-sigma B factor antagonist